MTPDTEQSNKTGSHSSGDDAVVSLSAIPNPARTAMLTRSRMALQGCAAKDDTLCRVARIKFEHSLFSSKRSEAEILIRFLMLCHCKSARSQNNCHCSSRDKGYQPTLEQLPIQNGSSSAAGGRRRTWCGDRAWGWIGRRHIVVVSSKGPVVHNGSTTSISVDAAETLIEFLLQHSCSLLLLAATEH